MRSTDDDLDIAIIGMAGRFPGAEDLEQFWRNLADGVDSIARFTDRELIDAGVPSSHIDDATYVKASPVLERPFHFDAGFFGFAPAEADALDPQHRLLLELAHEALEDAGYDPDRHDGRIGVFTGAALNTYALATGLGRRLERDYIPTLIGADKDFLATRLSYKLNLKGPSITVQTACSTSMVAIHLACQSLLSGESDIVIAGAASVRVPHRAGYFAEGGGVVSPDARVRAFAADANGTVFGSGGGIVVLKRLSAAIEDRDTVRAVIRGSAVNNDGAAKAGYTAPSVDGQADVVIEALANAGVDAAEISYLEAHGTGTPVGDPIEVRALTRAFRVSTSRTGYCAIGSVKTNVGHLDAAAAVTGIIKTVLALEHRAIPPSLHFTAPNPAIAFETTPFFVNTTLRQWSGTGPRRAAVMSTGMGGTNACLVLEEAPGVGPREILSGPELLVLSARTRTALDESTTRIREELSRRDETELGDLAHTLRVGRKMMSHRRYVVCNGREDALAALAAPASRRIATARVEGGRRPLVMLLPGLGDHYVGMGQDLYDSWPAFRDAVDHCARLFESLIGVDVRKHLYPDGRPREARDAAKGMDLRQMLGRSSREGDEFERALDQTLVAHPVLFTIEYALASLWRSLGVVPDAIVGHSMGECVAACIADVMSLDDACRLVASRARSASELPEGAMLAVTMTEEALRSRLPGSLSVALINGPELCVVAGPVVTVKAFERELDADGIVARRVRNTHAFHSRMLDPIVPALERELRELRLKPPSIPFTSNVTGAWITAAQATDPRYWAGHAARTARFNDAVQEIWRLQVPILLEAGPGRTLGVLATQHPARPAGNDGVAISSLRHVYENRSDVEHLLNAAGRLWTAGVEPRWESLPARGNRRRIPLPTYPFERELRSLQPEPSNAPAQPDGRASPPTQVQKRDPAAWLYAPSWKRSLRRTGVAAPARWLVFADDSGCASAVTHQLVAAGHDVVTVHAGSGFERRSAHSCSIDPADPHDYATLVRSLDPAPQFVVHAWSVGDTGTASSMPGEFDDAQRRGFYSLLYLARALAAHTSRTGEGTRMFVLSEGAHEVLGTESLSPSRATLLGPCMTIGQEYPEVRVTSIDLETPGSAGYAGVVDALIGELTDPGDDLFVALRGGRRWIQAWEPLRSGDTASAVPAFRDEGVYLITGGLGRIGLALSQHLSARHRARLVLVGRSGPRGERATAIERIERLGGTVLCLEADVSDEGAMHRVVTEATRRFGSIDGVIHAAGIVGDHREIRDSTPAGCAPHFRAKAHGVRALAAALEGTRPDFVLLMSSLSSVLGGVGQATYAASNLYLDAFARARNRTAASPWLSVNWDVWRLGDDDAAPGAGTTLAGLGMTIDEATGTLDSVLALKQAGQVIVSTGDLEARLDQWIRLSSLRAAPPAPSSDRRGATPDGPRDETEARVARIWEDVLGVAPVGIHDGFAALGGHSLLAIRIVSELRRAFELDLPVRALFEAPTVAQLSRLIEERLVAEIDALSDDEARALVTSQ